MTLPVNLLVSVRSGHGDAPWFPQLRTTLRALGAVAPEAWAELGLPAEVGADPADADWREAIGGPQYGFRLRAQARHREESLREKPKLSLTLTKTDKNQEGRDCRR